ncbi:right-handed parallel beta-helix repeat-containing protein [Sphingomonas oligophenolica]|uniref:Right-handed parallel beta-helix repeat-containing protein n=1 Tax=Sphingomonas oligophenolica TaxID=301154 RepID=A0ABU9YAV3_9SPHN
MTRLIKMLGIAVSALLFSLCFAAPASAQATRTWISGVGDDANPCSRTAPCKTWAGAISKTAAGGEIDCLDPGGFGSVTITKSITLDCAEGEGGSAGGILNSGVPGVIINDPNGGTAPTIKVYLRNLNIDGAGVTVGTYAVRFLSGKSLTMQNVLINNQGTGGVPAVSFEPSTASVGAKLVMKDVFISNTLGNGVQLTSSGAVAIGAILDNVTISDTNVGLEVNDGATATVIHSNISYNYGRGIEANSVGGTIGETVNVDGATIAGNTNIGIAALVGATVRVSNSGIYANGQGLKTSGGGTIQSFTNNRLGPDAGNPGLPTTSVVQK